MDLFTEYRPTKLEEFVADEQLYALLESTLKQTKFQCMLFYGPSGAGKTSFARILSKELGAEGLDFKEENCGDRTGVDYARDWVRFISAKPMTGKARVLVLDEAHKLTNAAQQCLLKGMEDLHSTNYVIICSTDPDNLINTIRTRCGCKINFTPTNLDSDRLISGMGQIVSKLSPNNDGGEQADKIVAEYLESNTRHTFSLREFLSHAHSIINGGSSSSFQSSAGYDPQRIINFLEMAKTIPDAFSYENWGIMADTIVHLNTTPESCRIRMLRYFTKRLATGARNHLRYYNNIMFALLISDFQGPDGEAKLLVCMRAIFRDGESGTLI